MKIGIDVSGVVRLTNGANLKTSRHLIILTYANQKDLSTLTDAATLATKIRSPAFGGEEAFQAIVGKVKPLMQINGDSSLEDLGHISKLIPGLPEEEQRGFEQEVIKGVLAQTIEAKQVAEFAQENFRSVTGHNGLLLAFLANGTTHSMETLTVLREAIYPDMGGDSDEKVFMTIQQMMADGLANKLKEAETLPLEELGQLAKMIHDGNDGSGSQEAEDTVISVAVKQVSTAEEAADFAGKFGTKTGRHRFIIAWVNEHGVSSEEDVSMLKNAIRCSPLYGGRAKSALLKAAEQAGVEIDVDAFFEGQGGNGSSNPLEALLGGDVPRGMPHPMQLLSMLEGGGDGMPSELKAMLAQAMGGNGVSNAAGLERALQEAKEDGRLETVKIDGHTIEEIMANPDLAMFGQEGFEVIQKFAPTA